MPDAPQQWMRWKKGYSCPKDYKNVHPKSSNKRDNSCGCNRIFWMTQVQNRAYRIFYTVNFSKWRTSDKTIEIQIFCCRISGLSASLVWKNFKELKELDVFLVRFVYMKPILWVRERGQPNINISRYNSSFKNVYEEIGEKILLYLNLSIWNRKNNTEWYRSVRMQCNVFTSSIYISAF